MAIETDLTFYNPSQQFLREILENLPFPVMEMHLSWVADSIVPLRERLGTVSNEQYYQECLKAHVIPNTTLWLEWRRRSNKFVTTNDRYHQLLNPEDETYTLIQGGRIYEFLYRAEIAMGDNQASYQHFQEKHLPKLTEQGYALWEGQIALKTREGYRNCPYSSLSYLTLYGGTSALRLERPTFTHFPNVPEEVETWFKATTKRAYNKKTTDCHFPEAFKAI